MQTMTRALATVELFQAGQSPWLDFISRELIVSGKMKRWAQEQGVLGVTSNPSIFEKAIGQGASYDADIKKLVKKGSGTFEIYDALTISDIQATCDLFLSVFKKTKGEHGFVSLEVSPDLAYDTETTVAEAKRLFKAVNRPNVMIKIPATPEGIPAVRAVIGSGINVNITLMFSMRHYQDVANAYVEGLADFQKKGGDVTRVFSVASVFVSRIDTLLDKKLEALIANNPALGDLKGKAAVANSKLIYQEFKKIFASDKFRKLQTAGAHVQKVLWGSTSVKNPAYSDLLYVENLVGKDTVNTMPMNTLEAVLDHGIIRPNTIEEGVDESRQALSKLKELGFDLNQIGEQLQEEGVKAFIESFDVLMRTLEVKRGQFSALKISATSQAFQISSAMSQKLTANCASLEKQDFLNRFLNGDVRLWKDDPAHQASIKNRLGWLKAPEWILGKLYEIDRFCEKVKQDGIKDIVLLGMGGSSLAPEVMSLICSRPKSSPRFFVLDTTDPSTVLEVKKKIKLKSTLFIVASKSGSTIETMSQFQFFFDAVQKEYGKKDAAQVGQHFVAITDPGSSLEKLSNEKMFRKTFINPANIGGRFSALSFFGMVPAALLGINIRQLLQAAIQFSQELTRKHNLIQNPGIALGVLLAEFAKQGDDKVTLLTSKELSSFGTWLEQLIAESTGKEGKGVVIIEGKEPASDVKVYGKGRVFVALKLKGKTDAGLAKAVQSLKKAGYPIISVEWPSSISLGEEFLKWEVVTAVAGVQMGINPFDEPNVKESKDNTAILLGELKKKGKFENPKNYISGKAEINLGSFFAKRKPGAYVALLAYVERNSKTAEIFNRIRKSLREAYKLPVLLGFGPRYLHSIGQLYKGGTPNGLFFTFLKQEGQDLKIPGAFYTFGQLKKAQALGDIQALESKGLPVMAIDLGKDFQSGLKSFEKQLDAHLREL